MRFGRAFVLLCIVSLPLRPIAAQAERDSTIVIVLGTLQAGQHIRVGLLRERWTGRYLGYNGDTLFLGGESPPPMAIRFNAVDTLWLGRNGWRRGAKAGAITGGIAGGVFLGALAHGFGANSGFLGGFVVGGATGGAAGAVVGALIGAGRRQWKQLFPP